MLNASLSESVDDEDESRCVMIIDDMQHDDVFSQ
jgi:hypothetical protein